MCSVVGRFLNTSPSSPTSAVSENCVSAERTNALVHTTLIMMIMETEGSDTGEAQYKYQLVCKPSCRVTVGVDLSNAPAKPPR